MTSSSKTANPAMLFAALSGPFDPVQALRRLDVSDVQQLAMAASYLADTCDTLLSDSSNQWLMRTPFRHSLLQALDADQLPIEVAERRLLNPDSETKELLGVLLDEFPLDRKTIQVMIGSSAGAEGLERIIVALDRAGVLAPARDLLPLARSALAELHRGTRRQLVAERGFFGREEELAKIGNWIAHPVDNTPVGCLFITGAPGIGKSSLLAEAVRRHFEHSRPLMLRLDFDRAGLDVQDSLGLTQEAARQLAEQLGEAGSTLLQARLQAGLVEEYDSSNRSNLRQQFPVRLADAIGLAVKQSKRLVLVILDTLEVLRGRGETHPASLFRWLDSLVRHGVKPMVILAAGRGDAFDSLREAEFLSGDKRSKKQSDVRRVEVLKVDQLPPIAASTLLKQLHVDDQVHEELLTIGAGSPLKLRLAAEIVKRTDLKHLRRKSGAQVSEAFLYRLLLSRIDDPTLRSLAHPGLIVRRINADVIQHVLSPALGLKSVSSEQAQVLLEQLAAHHWLVEPDPGAAGFLKHRSDMRRLLLPLLYQSSPTRSAKVDAAAVRWFGARPEAWAQVEAIYHQLQLSRTGRPVPSVSPHLAAQIDEDALDELPMRAADVVRRTRGQRTNQSREMLQSGSLERDEKLLEEELLALIRKQDWQEGTLVVRKVIAQGGIDPRSLAADSVRTFLWRSGQWAEARNWLRHLDAFDRSDRDLSSRPAAIRMARLEMRAEFTPATFRKNSRTWESLLLQLYRDGNNATGSSARQGALALIFRLLRGEGINRRVALGENDDSEEAAVAALSRWGGRSEDVSVQRSAERARRRLADAGIADMHPIRDTPFGSALASLTPYASCLINHIVASQRTDIHDWARTAAAVLSKGARILHPRLRFDHPPDTDSIIWLTNVGLFSEWLQATVFVRPDKDLMLISRSAERWRRTIAGDWSYGRPPDPWRGPHTLDVTISERLKVLQSARTPADAALSQIEMWGSALSFPSLYDLLRKRLHSAISEAHSATAGDFTIDLITRRLVARGAPAAVAPALAVLIKHRAL